MYTTQTKINFPAQKISTSKKGDTFFKNCIDSAIDNIRDRNQGLRQSKDNIIQNYDLANDNLDPKWIQNVQNPWKLDSKEFPHDVKNYPLVNPKLDLLVGEEIKRKFDWTCMVINPEAVSEKEDLRKQQIDQHLLSLILSKNLSKQQKEEEIAKIDKWDNWTVKDLREKRSNEYLEYLWRKLNLKQTFNEAFYDVLVAGEEVYGIEVWKGQPYAYRCDPRSLDIYRLGSSKYLEDADIIIYEEYMPLGKIVDKYELKEKEIKVLESGEFNKKNIGGSMSYSGYALPNWLNPTTDFDNVVIDLDSNNEDKGPYDDNGCARVTRVCWKSFRKKGKLKYQDEEGVWQEDLVDEYYKADTELGEKVEWFWETEWLEGTRIADNIYTKMEPIRGNYSPYVGTLYTIGNSQARSLMDRAKSFQFMYNIFMYNLLKAFAKMKGIMPVVDLARIPDEWTLDMWMYYAEEMGYAIEDSFNEGNKGSAQGKIAGNLSTRGNSLGNDLGNYIQQHINVLAFIEQKIGDIVGVTKQREGQIDNRETLGGVERAVTQSSHITEKWFYVHDNTKIRVLKNLLEAAKYAWRNKKETVQFFTDNMSQVITEIDGEMLTDIELGIDITNTPDDNRIFSMIESNAGNLLQNDEKAISTLIKIATSKSLAYIRNTIEDIEDEKILRSQEAEKANRETQERIAQLNVQDKQEERKILTDNNIRDNQTIIQAKLLDIEAKKMNTPREDNTIDLEKIMQMQEKIDNDFKLKQESLKETERANRKKESLEEEKIKISKRKPMSK